MQWAFGARCEIEKMYVFCDLKQNLTIVCVNVCLHYVCADVYDNGSNTVDRITTHVISSIDRIICYVSLTTNDSSRNCFSLC